MKIFYICCLAVLLLAACRTPTVSQDPAKMSADTLCFRYASSKDPKLAAEIDARNLNCADLLQNDPLYSSRRELDAAHRIGR